MKYRREFKGGFTIVELLIVVVIIAILAAITVAAYSGITSQARDATLKSDLKNGVTKLEIAKVDTGSYPSGGTTLSASSGNSLHYAGGGESYCLQVSNSSGTYRKTNTSSIEAGSCPAPTTMQAMTPGYCASLTTFTGSNSSAVLSLTDNRGGTTRTYEVAKLADGKCWMLTNLKLGSTTGTITLTSADSNVVSNFTLPQLITSGAESYDDAHAYGPIPGDTGSGATNYGYLYNWLAATAGATRTTNPAGSGNAASSICPAGWRLPNGGDWGTATNELSNLSARMAGLSGPTDSGYSDYTNASYSFNWRYTGPFKGVLSGGKRDGVFYDQGSWANLWSRTAFAYVTDRAHYTFFGTSTVNPGGNYLRTNGMAIRCLLN